MDTEIIDLCDSDEDDKSTIDLVRILPSAPPAPPAPVGPPMAPPRYTTNNFEKSFLNSSSSIPEAEQLIAECSLCNGVFNSTAAFISHMKSYHRLSNLFECTFCHQIFGNQVGLKHHMDTVHPPTQASLPRSTCLSCDICGDKFKFQEALNAHKEVHIVEKKFSIEAENLDTETESKKYTCSICLKKFFVEKALLLHRKKKHVVLRKSHVMMKARPKVGNFTCDICEKVFPAYRNLSSHRRWHFKRDPSLKDKMLTNQSSNENLISAVVIPEATSDSKQTESSQPCRFNLMQTSEPAKPKEFPCNTCDRVFYSKQGLGRHTSWHIRIAKRLRSSQRQMETRKKNLTKEGLTNKLKISIQLFPNNKAKIKRPILNDNNKETSLIGSEGESSLPELPSKPSNPSKAFACKLCNETFLYCYNYRQHMETHRTKKPLCCNICGEFFAFKCSLQTHEYIQHNPEKVSYCKLCYRPYVDKYSLEVHFRSCYLMARKFQTSVSVEGEQIASNSTTANPMPLKQTLSSSADITSSTFREPYKSTSSTYSEASRLTLNHSLSASGDITPPTFREPFKSTSNTYHEANCMPSNQSLSSSAHLPPSKFREPPKSASRPYSEVNPMPMNQSLSSGANMTPSKYREPCKSTNCTYSEASPMPMNQSLSTSTNMIPSNYREPYKSTNHTYSEANPMPMNQSLSSIANMTPSKYREPYKSINRTYSEASPMPMNQSLSSSANMTPSFHGGPYQSTNRMYSEANPMPMNQSLSSSANMTPSKFREPYKSTNSTYSESQSCVRSSLSLFDRGYYYCNICEKKYSAEVHLLRHVLIMHPSENYPFDSSLYSQQAQDSPVPSIEENFESSFLNCSSPPCESNDSSQNQELFNRENPVECSDPLSLDPLIEPVQPQGTHDNEQNSFQNLAPSNQIPLNLAVSCDQVEAMRAFSEYLVTVDRMSLKPTVLNNNNSDLSLHSLQKRRHF